MIQEALTIGDDRLIECGDAAGLAAAMANLIEDRERHQALCGQTHQSMRARFGIEAHVRQIQAVYDEALAERPGA